MTLQALSNRIAQSNVMTQVSPHQNTHSKRIVRYPTKNNTLERKDIETKSRPLKLPSLALNRKPKKVPLHTTPTTTIEHQLHLTGN